MTTTADPTRAKARAASSAQTLKLLRQIHLYFGLFISPAVLFFAFTGAVQTLSLHEAAGTSYKPPAVLAVWGQIHKKQTWMLPARRPAPGEGHSEGAPSGPSGAQQTAAAGRTDGTPEPKAGGNGIARGDSPKFSAATAPASASGSSPAAQPAVTLSAKQKQHLPLKLFFLVVSLGLFTSTFTGIYMAYRYERNKLLVTGLLLAGIVLPILLLPF